MYRNKIWEKSRFSFPYNMHQEFSQILVLLTGLWIADFGRQGSMTVAYRANEEALVGCEAVLLHVVFLVRALQRVVQRAVGNLEAANVSCMFGTCQLAVPLSRWHRINA
jgi:hypothetical protein